MLTVLKTHLLEDLGLCGVCPLFAQRNAVELLAIELNIKGTAAKVLVCIRLDARAGKCDAHACTSASLGLGTAMMLVGLATPRAPRTVPSKCGIRIRFIDRILDDIRGLPRNGKRNVARAGNTGAILRTGLDLDHAVGALDGQQAVCINRSCCITALGADRPSHIGSRCISRGNLRSHLKRRVAL